MMVVTSAPGKLILLGEHAVVFGQPAVAMAINRRLTCRVHSSEDYRVNGWIMNRGTNPYVSAAIESIWRGSPLSVHTESQIPSGSGLGSSAAVSVSVIAALMRMRGGFTEMEVARGAFEVERAVQGRASPIDTSVSAHGCGIFIDRSPGSNLLWKMSTGAMEWYVHHIAVPEMTFVVGYTGIHASTGPLVEGVRRLVEKKAWAQQVVEEIGSLSMEGSRALRGRDLVALGNLMNENQELLSLLGVSCPELDKLIQASLPYAYGAKLTGAGGGGSMVALTDRAERVCEIIERSGGQPIVVSIGEQGVRIED
jgi:mevalonate kinase